MILLTGGLGYIGSHMAAALIEQGRDFVLLDNLSNSRLEVLARLEQLAGRPLHFEQVDVCDQPSLERVLAQYQIQSVVHFAAFKSLNESVIQPLKYYQNNVVGTLSLLRAMQACDVRTLVFSSTAAVYGVPEQLPIDEQAPTRPMTPYGHSKLVGEQMMRDVAQAESGWKMAMLRYFNPAGAHSSSLIGESPEGIPPNLMPYIVQVAKGQRPCLNVYGDDYATCDGTGVRDYIHVMDLVEGHLSVLDWLNGQVQASEVFNLGCGHGFSVLQMIAAFERVTQRPVPYVIQPRREGDAASVYANADHAAQVLGWQTHRSIDDIAQDMWRFEMQYQV